MQTETTSDQNSPPIRRKVRYVAKRVGDRVIDGVERVGTALETAVGSVREILTPDHVVEWPTQPPDVFGATHRGRERDENEDQFIVAELSRSMHVMQSSGERPPSRTRFIGRPQGYLMAVADGVGSHPRADIASETAVQTIASYAFRLMPWMFSPPGVGSPVLEEGLRRGVERCQQKVQERAHAEGLPYPPGTTLTAAYVCWPNLYVVHVGDSRCYVVRVSQDAAPQRLGLGRLVVAVGQDEQHVRVEGGAAPRAHVGVQAALRFGRGRHVTRLDEHEAAIDLVLVLPSNERPPHPVVGHHAALPLQVAFRSLLARPSPIVPPCPPSSKAEFSSSTTTPRPASCSRPACHVAAPA